MFQVERHNIKETPEIIKLCSLSKELYNKCNYYIRQIFFDNKKNNKNERLPDMSKLINLVECEDFYKNLHNTKTAKQTIRKVLTDWSNFFKSLKSFKRDRSKFIVCPRPPKYKKELSQVFFYSETIRKKPLKDGVIQPTNDIFSIKSNVKDFKQVVITPKTFGFVIEIQYERIDDKCKKMDGICSIDIGLNNLCSITSDRHRPLLINGRILKSLNQWYNKKKNKDTSEKRYWRIENYFHHVSKLIIENCKRFDIGTIIIGKNDGWKQNMNIGKINNQNFQYVPFYRLLNKIMYKAEIFGIDVIFHEESWTSKSSFIDGDPCDGSIISGKRLKRGLYESRDGYLLNADVNGSLNIAKKCSKSNPKLETIVSKWDRSLAARPLVINPLRTLDFADFCRI